MNGIIAWVKGLTLTGKIISACVAGAVVIGGTATAVLLANNGGGKATDTGTQTSSVFETRSSETNSTEISKTESESASSAEGTSSAAESSKTDTPSAASSGQSTSTTTSSAPQPAAFAVYIGGKAVDLGTLEQVNQKVTIEDYGTSAKKDLSGDVYADAEKLIAALGLKTVSGKTKEDILRNFFISDNALIIEARAYENEYGNFVMFFTIDEGAAALSESGLCYEKSGNISVGANDSIVSTLKIKKVNGKLFVPVSLICELLKYNYEFKDTGFYITK